jgi:hypothetical protein
MQPSQQDLVVEVDEKDFEEHKAEGQRDFGRLGCQEYMGKSLGRAVEPIDSYNAKRSRSSD